MDGFEPGAMVYLQGKVPTHSGCSDCHLGTVVIHSNSGVLQPILMRPGARSIADAREL